MANGHGADQPCGDDLILDTLELRIPLVALDRLADEVVPLARDLLQHESADVRQSGLRLLLRAGNSSRAAQTALERPVLQATVEDQTERNNVLNLPESEKITLKTPLEAGRRGPSDFELNLGRAIDALRSDVPAFADLNPSVENIVRVAWSMLEGKLPGGAALDELRLWETGKTVCAYRGD